MIQVEKLTRRFVDVDVVREVSFEVARGEVVGFLGPNGAGKTTTMRVLCGYLPPTSGTAKVAGFDVVRHSREVRRRIGYLPENVPLYPEMRVSEYLEFRARLRRVPRRQRGARIDAAVARSGLGEVRRRIIGQLSRGYRQRVGLADALVHDPPILVLDEPTVGLDPNQIREVRDLVRELGRDHTILLSTHILPEVEAVCGRVIIIRGGRIVASGTPEELRGGAAAVRHVRVEARGPAAELRAAIERVPGVTRVSCDTEGDGLARLSVETDGGRDLREHLSAAVARGGWPLRELHAEAPGLEDVFHEITTRE